MISGSDPRPNTQPEIVIERVFDGPPALVWRTWTDPEHVMRWWGPKGFTSPVCKADFRVGGSYLYCMRSPQGKDFWTTGVYLEIVEPERIVYTDCFSDADGNLVPASRWGLTGDWPNETLVTVTFEEQDGKTRVTLRHANVPADHITEFDTGWKESLDKLAEGLVRR